MPIFKSGQGRAPKWGELDDFEIVRLAQGESHRFERKGTKEKLILAGGSCLIQFEGQRIFATERTSVNLTTPEGFFQVSQVQSDAILVRMWGNWGSELGGSGVFKVARAERLAERGDPVAYPKETNFDNHYHDCDEYWIIVEGKGTAVSEGKHYEVVPGDCIATRMGDHHDFPIVVEDVKAVFFETTLRGLKRRGHLWNHTHAEALPKKEGI